ncbi:MAG: cytochrome c oxidase subunit 4 [Nocardioidaceae bacterium]|nr:cytochrome c oxidase subunit 4 [Nocardioidaceae bacterium]MCL2614336.1 cytochrome c oxidase subunit 4 [Nocardioidaceae bacterium]
MKIEAWIFGITTIFLILVTPAYWLVTEAGTHCGGQVHCGDWTGTAALTMTTFLMAMITLYLGFHARRMDARPEDRKEGEIAEGAGELGFFPPYSWWPMWCGLCLGVIVFAVAMTAWWLMIIGIVLGALSLSGLVFEYYRGEHAH